MSFSLSMAVIRKLFSFPFSRVILGHSLVFRTTRKLPCVRITTKSHHHFTQYKGNQMNAMAIKDLLYERHLKKFPRLHKLLGKGNLKEFSNITDRVNPQLVILELSCLTSFTTLMRKFCIHAHCNAMQLKSNINVPALCKS